ncbi:hypothetical protein LVD15_23155 [Fulvivirga maritima]|uniref:hypothetical protein n=1 Tax=Fulvivirga maritima TaxID=2904247 RepID=UPI001F446385|nr:hypothetical protein [Fulvivirga maritima]UII26168.1 hypothetical protein LVD15_23155 [Fulvivirga maritima]
MKKTTFGYQYHDFDPDFIEMTDVEVDLEGALKLFHDFPWEEQYAKVSAAKEDDFTYTIPAIYFFESEHLCVSIYSKDSHGFSLFYRNGDRCGQLFLSNDPEMRPEGVFIEQLLADFYNGTIEETLELYELPDDYDEKVSIQIKNEFSKSKLWRKVWILFLPLLIPFFVMDIMVIPITLLLLAILGFIILPEELLRYRYWKNDHDQTIEYSQEDKILKINKAGKLFQIHKSKPKYELVYCDRANSAFNKYAYLRIITGEKIFMVTSFSFHPVELLEILAVNHRQIEVSIPRLRSNELTDKEKRREQSHAAKRKQELLNTYESWPTEKLQEVIAAPDKYAAPAIEAASIILQKRSL